MSYARFGWEGSDVYVIGTREAGRDAFMCCGCLLVDAVWVDDSVDRLLGGYLRPINAGESTSPTFPTRSGILAHLAKHQAAGHTVPESCIERLANENGWGEP